MPILPASSSIAKPSNLRNIHQPDTPVNHVVINRVAHASFIQAKDVISQIVLLIKSLFPQHPRNIYSRLLNETQNINAQYEGFSLLHYCVYLFSHVTNTKDNGKKLLDLIEYLVLHGSNIDNTDQYGRTPIYFASTLYASQKILNQRYWKLLSIDRNMLNPPNKSVQPLHVIASLRQKYVIDLIEQGARTDAVDKYGRMPLHCATLHEDFYGEFFNVRALVSYEPKSAEHKDNFGNFPLYYAALFGSDELFHFLLKHSSRKVTLAVSEQFNTGGFPQSEQELSKLKEKYQTRDPIYTVPAALSVMYGGGKKANKKNRESALAEAALQKKTTYVKGGVSYDTYHDGHGWKHVIHENDYKKKYKSNRQEFFQSTKSGAAKFYPIPDNGYDNFLESCVKSWVDNGAIEDCLYVKCRSIIGVDNGNETDTVQIYFSSTGGAHIRPKYLP